MASSLWRQKDTLYFVLGSLFLFAGGIGIFIGVMYWFGFPYYAPENLPILGSFCTVTGVVPGLILVFFGWRAHRLEEELVEFAAWVKTYRRITLGELARKLDKTQDETEKALVQVVDRGLVRGFIDRRTNQFVLAEAVGEGMFVDRCPRCGGVLQRRYLEGETVVCPYCNAVIIGPNPAVPP